MVEGIEHSLDCVVWRYLRTTQSIEEGIAEWNWNCCSVFYKDKVQGSLWLPVKAALGLPKEALLELLVVHVHEAVHRHHVLLLPTQQRCDVVSPVYQALLKF